MRISIWIPVIVACVTSVGAFITTVMNRVWQMKDRKADKLDRLQRTLDAHIAEDEKRDILYARRRIIDFSDECRRGTRHSEEHFNSILSDIDTYERYCNDHADFKNRQAVASIDFITEIYNECKRNNDFI